MSAKRKRKERERKGTGWTERKREKEREERKPAVGISIFHYFLGRLFVVVSFGGIPLLPFRVCPFLVTFLKLITSAPSARAASFVSFLLSGGGPSRRSPLHLFPAAAAFLPLVSANGLVLTHRLSLFPNSSGPRLVHRDVFPPYVALRQGRLASNTFSPRRTYLETPPLLLSHSMQRASENGRASFRPHFPFSTRLPADRKRIATNHSLSTTTQAARSRAHGCRLPARSIRRFFGGRY